MNRNQDSRKAHSTPMVFVQVTDSYCVPTIEVFCNKPTHLDCVKELEDALKGGGFVVSTSFWAKYYNKKGERTVPRPTAIAKKVS